MGLDWPWPDLTLDLVGSACSGSGQVSQARLGASLQGTDSAMLLRTLLPRAPIDPIDTSASPGAVVAAAMLDPAYQLK